MIYEFGSHRIDPDVHELRCAGELVHVEPQVFDVLVHLVEHRDRTVTKEELLDAVWGDRFVSESALTSRIKAARRAVGDDGNQQAVIRTVHGRGYRFVAEVSPSDGGALPGATPRPPRRAIAPSTASPPRTRYATSGVHSIAYQVIDGRTPDVDAWPDLLVVPGFVSNVELQWEDPAIARSLTALASGRRLVVFDKRGTGVSERVGPDALPTLEERVDDLRAVLDAAEVERADLFGISEGGPLSLLFAAANPDRVGRLALFGTYAAAPLDDPAPLLQLTREWWGSGTVFGFLAPSLAADDDWRRAYARFERLSATPEVAAGLIDLANQIDVRGVLTAVTCPVLVLHRADDAVFPASGAQILADLLPAGHLALLEGADHYLFTDPEPVVELVRDFLTPDDPRPLVTGTSTTLTSIVALSGLESPDVAHDVLVDCAARSGASVDPTVGVRDGVAVITVDGGARAVRLASSLVDHFRDQDAGDVAAAVHTAEVMVTPRGVEGPGIGIAAAAAALAAPGQVLVTRTVTDLVAGSGLAFDYQRSEVLGDDGRRWELHSPAG